MSSSNGRLSFKQSLLIAFFIMAALFGASYFIAINTLDYLANRSQETAYNGITINALGQSLASTSRTMERSARQYMVLLDEPLLQNYLDQAQKSNQIIESLALHHVIANHFSHEWQAQTIFLTYLLRMPLEEDGSSKNTNSTSTQLQRVDELLEQFKSLECLQSKIHEQIENSIEQKNSMLLQDIVQNQNWMRQIMIGLLILVFLMAIGFGTWFAKPFKRIEKTLLQLGQNKFDTPIEIHGPSDVRMLGQRLEWLRIRLAEIDADKARFLRHTSHELKTPLAALREGISLLQEELAGELNNNQKDVVQILQQNSIILQKQIEALLLFNAAAFDARKLNRTQVNLLELAEDQIDLQRLQWQAHNLNVELSGETVVLEVDAEKIAIAISNLLSNAIRFSPQEGKIEICISKNKQFAHIDIIDQGLGIDVKDRQYIFDPFYRGKIQPISKTRGSGVGLSVVHEYVTAHGGDIHLMPSDQGAHFQIELPYVTIY